MAKYTTFKRKDLVKAAKRKNVTVTSSHKGRAPTKADYVKALKDFDMEYAAAHPFRFMDLSPELRTRVYRELLTFDNSWTCHPEILAVSKQLNEEATNILYGDNLFEVKIWPREVQAHGLRCGAYSLMEVGFEVGVDALEWPGMLHKAQWLRISLPQDLMDPDWASELSHAAVQQIMYSLCSFLSKKHQLRSTVVDLRPLGLHASDEVLAHFIRPLTMLGTLKEMMIKLSDSKTVEPLDLTPTVLAAAVAASSPVPDPNILDHALSEWAYAKRYYGLVLSNPNYDIQGPESFFRVDPG